MVRSHMVQRAAGPDGRLCACGRARHSPPGAAGAIAAMPDEPVPVVPADRNAEGGDARSNVALGKRRWNARVDRALPRSGRPGCRVGESLLVSGAGRLTILAGCPMSWGNDGGRCEGGQPVRAGSIVSIRSPSWRWRAGERGGCSMRQVSAAVRRECQSSRS